MQTQLFLSGAIAALSFVSLTLAHGPDSPDQVSRPHFSVTRVGELNLLTLNGTTAETVFDQLTDPEVRRFSSEFYQIKKGFGILCVWRSALQDFSCWQKLTDDGDVKNLFPYTESLKNSPSSLLLRLKGPAMEQLYSRMSDDGDIAELEDGSLALIKQRTAITCTKLLSPDGGISFDCSQLLTRGGLPRGDGTDPMIGSGTRPLTVEVMEGGN